MSSVDSNEKSIVIVKEGDFKDESREIVSSNSSSSQEGIVGYDQDLRKTRFQKKKSWSDIFTIICTGVALISDGYQNNLMTMMNAVFTAMYPQEYTASLKTGVSNALTVGEIIGQVSIGLTCDYLGRKWAIITTTILIIIGSIMCAAANGVTITGMFWMLIVSRGVVGYGVGGEYPACSTAASEAANEASKKRGAIFVLVTNLPLSLGGPFAIIIFLIVNKICGPQHYAITWRLCFGLGIVWPLSIFYFRYKMATSVLYKRSLIRRNVPYLLTVKYYWPRMIGTCGCWFIYDFVTFPNGIFSSTITSSLLGTTTDLEKIGEWNLLLGWISIPGLLLGAYLMDRLGRKYTLMIGFSGYLVIGLIIGCGYSKLSKIVPLFIVLYGLFNGFGSFGPGNCMGLVSSECYATPVRGTLYGLSAALGKTGAVIGTQCFTPIQNHLGKNYTFIIAALLGFVGLVLAWFTIPHLKDDDLMMEDVRFENYLIANGWTGKFGLEEDTTVVEKGSDSEGVVIKSTQTELYTSD